MLRPDASVPVVLINESPSLAVPQNGAGFPPAWYLVSHRHICAIPRFQNCYISRDNCAIPL